MNAHLQPLTHEGLLRVLSGGVGRSYDFTLLGRRRAALFISISDTDRSLDFLAKMCVSQAVRALADYADDICGGALSRHVRVVLDDFATMGAFPGVASWANSLRSRNVGMTLVCQSQVPPRQGRRPSRLRRDDIVVALGGRAASEVRLGAPDTGARSDLNLAYSMARDLHGDLCCGGFSLLADHRASEKQRERVDSGAAASLEVFYLKAKEVLCRDRGFLKKMARALAAKDVLLAADVKAIREECEIGEVAV